MANPKPDRTRKVDWTPENLEKARQLRNQGYTDAEIGRFFDVSGTRIAQKIGNADRSKPETTTPESRLLAGLPASFRKSSVMGKPHRKRSNTDD